MTIGILHPGNMGAALASNIDGEVLWCSEGRSAESALRAGEAGLHDAGDLSSLAGSCEVIISICPPAAAVDVAREVHETGYEGLYVDVNAVSPDTSREIGQFFVRYVDGGIIGPPPVAPSSSTRLYLSGEEAAEVADMFRDSHVDTRVIGEKPGRASALKAAYAGWTKGSSSLLLAVAAFAVSEEVVELLQEEWALSIPELPERLEWTSSTVGSKAWRFIGEMEEIAAAFDAAGLPVGFHLSAAEVYRRLAPLRGQPGTDWSDAIARLLLGRTRDQLPT